MTRTTTLASMVLLAMFGCGGDDANTPVDGAIDGPVIAPPDSAFDSAPGTPITYTIVSLDGLPEDGDIVLVSDNDGPWHAVTGTGGVYTTNVVGPRYAIARACRDPEFDYAEAYLWYLTLDDATAINDLGCRESGTGVVLSGALTGVAGNKRGYVSTGTSFASAVIAAGATDYSVTVPTGTTDVVARLFPSVPSSQPRPTQRLLVERDVAITGDLDHPLDFTAAGVDPETHTFTVTGATPGSRERVDVALSGSGPFELGLESTLLAGTDDYHTLPAALMEPDELLTVTRSSADDVSFRNVALTVDTAGDLTAALPPVYQATEPTVVGLAPVRLAGTLPHVDGADLYEANAFWFDDATFAAVFWTQIYTARYAGDRDAIDYTFPDLGSTGGWNVGLLAGTLDWNHLVTVSSGVTLPVGYPLPVVLGDTRTLSSSGGSLIVQ